MKQDRRNFFRILENGQKALEQSGIDDASANIRLIAEQAFAASWLDLNCNPPLNPDVTEFNRLISERKKRIPLQYLLGQAHFYESCFFVKPGVLIPRPETELLVELAVKHVGTIKDDAKVLDLCCGTGAIGISLKLECPAAEIICADISDTALEVCAQNAQKLNTDIQIVKSDLTLEFENKKRFDLIVSNPPYITQSEYEGLGPEVKDHEPQLALLAAENGLEFYRRILESAPKVLQDHGVLMMEIGAKQANDIKKLAQKSGIYDNFHVHKDLNELDRIITLRLA